MEQLLTQSLDSDAPGEAVQLQSATRAPHPELRHLQHQRVQEGSPDAPFPS